MLKKQNKTAPYRCGGEGTSKDPLSLWSRWNHRLTITLMHLTPLPLFTAKQLRASPEGAALKFSG